MGLTGYCCASADQHSPEQKDIAQSVAFASLRMACSLQGASGPGAAQSSLRRAVGADHGVRDVFARPFEEVVERRTLGSAEHAHVGVPVELAVEPWILGVD